MIRATRLRGLPVVDVESAVKIGRVQELILDPGRRRIAAVVVRGGRSLFGGGVDRTVPATAVVAVGADALTIRGVGHPHERGVELASYPTLTSMVNRKVLSRRGTLLGSVADVLLDERTGTIAGYALDVRTGGRGLFGWRGAAPPTGRTTSRPRRTRSGVTSSSRRTARSFRARRSRRRRRSTRARTRPGGGSRRRDQHTRTRPRPASPA